MTYLAPIVILFCTFLEKKETRKEEVASCLCSSVGGVVARVCVAHRCCPGVNEGLTRSHVSFDWEERL
jgi:hypothetical protein